MKKKTTVCVLGFIAIITILAIGFNTDSTGICTVSNDSNQLISQVKIEVCNQFILAENITPKQTFNFIYDITGDSHYTVHVKFNNNEQLTVSDGYVTNGQNVMDHLSIKRDGIELVKDDIVRAHNK